MKFELRKAKALWAEFSDVSAGTYASSIAYFAFLSLIPLLTLCISIVTMVGLGEHEVAEFFAAMVPDTFNGFAKTLIDDAYRQKGIAFSLSTVTLLWTASKGIRALRNGLNAAYGEQERRGAVAVAAISVGVALLFGILLAATVYLVFGDAVIRVAETLVPGLELHGGVLNVLSTVGVGALGIVALAACYAYLPSGSMRISAQLPGAALASVACGVLSLGFHVYVDNFCNFEALYGSIATVALFLFWLYLSAYILIAGAFLNRTLASRKPASGT